LVSDEATMNGAEVSARVVLRTDGASRGNPGPAAAGIVIERADGTVLLQLGRFLGEMPNNQAEYRALILGLELVAQRQPTAVDVYMDSELVVRQMTGVYQVRDATLRLLHREATALVEALPHVTFTHVRRAQNALADRLANQALNAQQRSAHQQSG
jgi:ribonuclease HI